MGNSVYTKEFYEMKSLKRFSKRQKIVALSLCALSLCALVVILGVVVLINTSVYRQLDEANVNVIFSRDIFGGLFGGQSMTFPPKAIKQIYDSPEIVQVPSNFNQWELLLKVAAQMSPSGDYNMGGSKNPILLPLRFSGGIF